MTLLVSWLDLHLLAVGGLAGRHVVGKWNPSSARWNLSVSSSSLLVLVHLVGIVATCLVQHSRCRGFHLGSDVSSSKSWSASEDSLKWGEFCGKVGNWGHGKLLLPAPRRRLQYSGKCDGNFFLGDVHSQFTDSNSPRFIHCLSHIHKKIRFADPNTGCKR